MKPPVTTHSATRFFLGVIFILSVTAVAKLYAAFGSYGLYLKDSDAVAKFLTVQQMMVAGAALEIVICLCISKARSDLIRARFLLGFTSILWTYRLVSLTTGSAGRCSCMGSLPQWLGIEPRAVEICMWALLCGLTLGAAIIYTKGHNDLLHSK